MSRQASIYLSPGADSIIGAMVAAGSGKSQAISKLVERFNYLLLNEETVLSAPEILTVRRTVPQEERDRWPMVRLPQMTGLPEAISNKVRGLGIAAEAAILHKADMVVIPKKRGS